MNPCLRTTNATNKTLPLVMEGPIYCGNGILAQMEASSCNKTLTMSMLMEETAKLFERETSDDKPLMIMGSHFSYGYGCRNLREVRFAHANAISQAKFIYESFGIKQRIEFKYAPVKHSRQPWKRRRNKKH